MNVLVTGGCGFIGSHLVRRLMKSGARVAIATRDTTNAWRLKDVIHEINCYPVDVRHAHQVEACVKNVRPHLIFHMAAYGVDPRQANVSDAVATNVMGTVNILEAARIHQVTRVVNLGSSSEYGDVQEAVTEEAPLEPLDIYGSTKAAATIIAHQQARAHHLSLITLRPFGVFGEYEASHKLFTYVITSALQHHAITLTMCEQSRDYCYVENVIDGLLLAAITPQVREAIFNIGTGSVRPLREYIDLILRFLPTTAKPTYGALPPRNNERWSPHPDVRQIHTQLGWKPHVSVEDGIAQTVAWFVKNCPQLTTWYPIEGSM